MTGFPTKLSETPARLRCPPRALGEHTDEVLRELGYDAERIEGLKGRGVL